VSDDIVGRLQAFLPPGSIVPGWLVQDAINEIERLRAAGDALAEVTDEWPELAEAWMEARRER